MRPREFQKGFKFRLNSFKKGGIINIKRFLLFDVKTELVSSTGPIK